MSIFEKDFSHAGLYQIGEVAKCCGVDRQTILFYEKKGLLSHTAQNESSGYRYYSPEDMANLLFILRVRDTGMSLSEISDFLKNGAPAAERATKNMEKKLAALLEGLAEVRAMSVKKGDYTVSWRSLPAMCCFVREYRCNSIAEATEKVYGLFDEALKRNLGVYAFYAEYPDEYKDRLNLDSFTMRACIQVRKGTGTPECTEIPAMSGISVCHRGDYTEIGAAHDALWAFARENNLTPIAPVREQYLDSRREYENDADRYVTLLILPVKETKNLNVNNRSEFAILE